jgi:hypothetical protein
MLEKLSMRIAIGKSTKYICSRLVSHVDGFEEQQGTERLSTLIAYCPC